MHVNAQGTFGTLGEESAVSTLVDPAIRALVVDETRSAHRLLLQILDEDRGVRSVDRCHCGREAVDRIASGQQNLVFLQVELPGLSGFEVLENLEVEEAPPVVLLAPNERSAARAFEYGALDYLTDPLSADRIRDALGRAKHELRRQRAETLVAEVGHFLEGGGGTLRARTRPPRIAVPHEKHIVYLPVRDIDRIEGAGYCVRLYARGEVFQLRRRLKDLARVLEPHGFFRIHRSHVVSLDRVERLRRDGRQSAAILVDGTELPISAERRQRFEERMRSSWSL